MAGQEFLRISRQLLDTCRKGIELCHEIQSGLNEDVRAGRINVMEWERGIKETDERIAYFKDELDKFDCILKGMKVY